MNISKEKIIVNLDESTSSLSSTDTLKHPPKQVEKLPFKDVLTESELRVKLADLGNACWTVSYMKNLKRKRKFIF